MEGEAAGTSEQADMERRVERLRDENHWEVWKGIRSWNCTKWECVNHVMSSTKPPREEEAETKQTSYGGKNGPQRDATIEAAMVVIGY